MAKIVLTIQADNKATQSVRILNAEVKTLSQTLSSIKVNKNLTAQINALTKHYKTVADAHAKIIASKKNEAIADEKLRLAEAKTATQIAKTNSEISRQNHVNALTEKATYSLARAKEKATQATQRQTVTTKANTVVNNTNTQSIISMTVNIFKWQIAMTSVMKPLRLLQDAWASLGETLVKTEDSVIAIQRVLSEDVADSEISSRLYKIAQDYGQTFENVSQIATNFARTGMSWADTIKATEAAVLALNVAELDAEEATTGLIAILSQFGLQASDLETVIDKLNKTADNFPVTTEKILAALQRTGSAADNANLSLDQTIALITALSKATGRSGQNIGTALNSLIQYSSKASALDTFANLSEDSAKVVAQYRQGGATILDVWKQVSKEIQNLKSEQADLLDGYFSTEDGQALSEALDGELEDIYTELGGVYDTANTFRKNYFIALLGNMDTVEQAMGTLDKASGYSQKENQKYLDTYTAKLNSLQAKWQDIANDEQGLLGIKKDLLDMGGFVLDIIKGVGGLKTALIAMGVVVGTIVMSFKGEVIIATLTKIGTLLKSLTIDAIPNAIGAWKSFAKGISSAGTALQASLPLITAVIIAVSALDSAIRRGIEKREEAERKAIEQQNEAIAKSNESVEAQKKEVAQMNEVATSVENLRKILDDSSQSEEEKIKAQDKLLKIQNQLIESNNSYKDSLDLTNGSLKEQLGLIEQLTTEQLKKKANDFLSGNASEIEIAKSRLESTSTTNTDMVFSSSGWLNSFDFRDVINSAITGAGVGDIASINEDNTYTVFDNYGKRVGEGFKNGFWNGVGELLGFGTVFDKTSYVGESNAGFSFSGTVEQQLEAIDKLKTYIATNKDMLGLSAEEVVAITTELGNRYDQLNSEEYKQAQLLAEKAKATQNWLDGTIDEAEYLKIVYGIEKDISKELGEQTNDISKATGAYDDLIKKLEELRDLNKEAYDWEEKKLAVLEAEQALENARNEATVRRFNQDTNQWEWQTDEKAIKEAEDNLQKAQIELERGAYDNIISQLEKGDATNESILAILQEVAPLLGADSNFVTAVTDAFKEKTGVDVTQPTKSYDSGGIANGLGFMPKATTQPETVNNPDLTAKILSPVSNAEFDRYVRDMGIMFEQAHTYARMPQFERVNNTSTDNSVNNSGQINFAGGLTVGSEQRDNMLNILSLAKIVPN